MSYIILLLLSFSIIIVNYQPINLSEYNKEKISVSIKGCVVSEKQVELDIYTPIESALSLVQLNDNADLSSINTNILLKDKDILTIPCQSEIVKININTATVEQLMTLPGIGESSAIKIIEYRNNNGLFNTIEDIKNVNGIKDSKFNKIKDYICL